MGRAPTHSPRPPTRTAQPRRRRRCGAHHFGGRAQSLGQRRLPLHQPPAARGSARRIRRAPGRPAGSPRAGAPRASRAQSRLRLRTRAAVSSIHPDRSCATTGRPIPGRPRPGHHRSAPLGVAHRATTSPVPHRCSHPQLVHRLPRRAVRDRLTHARRSRRQCRHRGRLRHHMAHPPKRLAGRGGPGRRPPGNTRLLRAALGPAPRRDQLPRPQRRRLYHWVWQHGARLARPVFGHGFLGLRPVDWAILIQADQRPQAVTR